MSSTPPHITLTPAQFRLALSAVMLITLLSALDLMIVSVAVPTIARELGDPGWMAWIVSGYLVASTVVTPLYGRFSDIHGRRSVLVAALLVFIGASVASALAQTLPQLVLARVLQGIGGGGLTVLAQSIIADIVPLRERGRIQGYASALWAGASMLGPVIGGVVTQYLSWRWIFWINLPMGLLSLWLVRRSLGVLPEGKPGRGVDWLGATLLLAGLTAFLLPITRLGQGVKLFDPWNLGLAAAAVAALAAFVLQQRRSTSPVLPLELLRQTEVRAGCMALFVCFFLFMALAVLVPLRLQLSGGRNAGDAAMLLLPLTLAVPAAVFVCGRWMLRSGRVRPLPQLGAVLVTIGMVALALLPPSQGLASALAMVILGSGMGMQMPTILLIVQNAVPRALVGTATALTVFFRLLGGAVGIAALTAIVLALLGQQGNGTQALSAIGQVAAADGAFRSALLVGALLSVLSVFGTRRLGDVQLHQP